MSKIDDIFRDGLSDKGLKYSESDWEAMSSLLNHKGSFFFRYRWWIRTSMVFIVAGFSTFISLYDFNTENQNSITAKPEVNDRKKNQSKLTPELPTIKNDFTTTNDKKEQNKMVNPMDYQTDNHQSDEYEISEESIVTMDGVESESDFRKAQMHSVKPDRLALYANKKIERKLAFDMDNDVVHARKKIWNNSHDVSTLEPYSIRGFDYDVNPNFKNIGVLKSPYSMWSLYASTYVGLLQYSNSIKLNNIIDENNHKSNELEIRSMVYGIKIAAQKNRWKFTTGLGVFSLLHETNYNLTTLEKAYIKKKKLLDRNYIISPRGKPIAMIGDVITDSTFTTIRQELCLNCTTNFEYWSIPFQFQYQTKPIRRISFFGGLGVNVDILKKATGIYAASEFNGTLDVIELEDKLVEQHLFRINGSMGVKYSLTKSWGMWSNYDYGYGLNSMLKSYEQIPKTISVQFGVEYKIR